MADGTVRKMLRGATVRGANRDRNAVPSPEDTRLEFQDCWLDPPRFRKAINTYEKELEGTHKALKNIIKHIDVSQNVLTVAFHYDSALEIIIHF